MNMSERPLSALSAGDTATITKLLCTDPAVRRRFLELGAVSGAPVTCLQRSPAGDPTAYLLCGAVLALRREDAEHILVTGEVKSI